MPALCKFKAKSKREKIKNVLMHPREVKPPSKEAERVGGCWVQESSSWLARNEWTLARMMSKPLLEVVAFNNFLFFSSYFWGSHKKNILRAFSARKCPTRFLVRCSLPSADNANLSFSHLDSNPSHPHRPSVSATPQSRAVSGSEPLHLARGKQQSKGRDKGRDAGMDKNLWGVLDLHKKVTQTRAEFTCADGAVAKVWLKAERDGSLTVEKEEKPKQGERESKWQIFKLSCDSFNSTSSTIIMVMDLYSTFQWPDALYFVTSIH